MHWPEPIPRIFPLSLEHPLQDALGERGLCHGLARLVLLDHLDKVVELPPGEGVYGRHDKQGDTQLIFADRLVLLESAYHSLSRLFGFGALAPAKE